MDKKLSPFSPKEAPQLQFQQPDATLQRNFIMCIPAMQHPGFRTNIAIQNNQHRKLLIKTWGGLGDQICAEPTLRYATTTFKDCTVSLHSERPELFQHLNFTNVFDAYKDNVNFDDYFVFETITPPDQSNMVWLFFNHMLTNCVDFPSMCAFRKQLANKDKYILLSSKEPVIKPLPMKAVYVHPGKHWPSKTFPKFWWDKVISTLVEHKVTPIIIGADTDDNRSTVDVDIKGCIDLRNKLTPQETTWLLQRAKVLLSNDSSPIHMAASEDPTDRVYTGNCWIGLIATVKHPDYLQHWRKGQLGWREVNHGKGGMWDIVDDLPNKDKDVLVDKVDESLLISWLPDPTDYAMWAIGKL